MPNWKKVVVSGSSPSLNRPSIDDYIVHNGDANSYIGFNGTDSFVIFTNNSRQISIGSNATTLEYAGSAKLATTNTGVSVTGAITVSGNINANGNIVGDDNTNITNIDSIQLDNIMADGDTTTRIGMGASSMDFLVEDDDIFDISTSRLAIGKPIISTSTISATGNISSSADVFGVTGSFHALVGDTSQATSLEVDGPITASGGIISDNIETFWTSFNCDGDANFANSSYGPNTQGINYYFWNKNWTSTTADGGDPTGDHVHRTEINSGWYVPYKIKVVGFCGGLHDGNAGSTSTCTVKLFNTVASLKGSDYDSNSGTTKALVASSGNVTLNGNRWKNFDVSGLSVTLSEGQYVLPRITMGENLTNLRGQFTIKYKRVV